MEMLTVHWHHCVHQYNNVQVCDDERVRLDAEFSAACKEVQDLRRDYRKHLRNTEKCKNQLQGLMQKQAKQNEIDRYNVLIV